MQPNKLYDLIIIGAGQDGSALCKYIAARTDGVSIAIVGRGDAPDLGKLSDQIDFFKGEVVYSDFLRGVIVLSFENGDKLCGKNVALATGTTPEKLESLPDELVYYKLPPIKRAKRVRQTVIVGDGERAVEAAEWASKKFKYVYVCSNNFNIANNEKLKARLDCLDNVLLLSGCYINGYKLNSKGAIRRVFLSTYDSLRCHALIVMSNRKPDAPKLNTKMVELDEEGYVKINHLGEMPLMPHMYACGGCTRYGSRRNITIIGKHIIADNAWREK